MASVRLSPAAVADYDAILDYLERKAGTHTAERYDREFEAAFDWIAAHPGIGAPRHKFGPSDTVLILRILHGSRRVTGRAIGRARRPA